MQTWSWCGAGRERTTGEHSSSMYSGVWTDTISSRHGEQLTVAKKTVFKHYHQLKSLGYNSMWWALLPHNYQGSSPNEHLLSTLTPEYTNGLQV